MRPEGPFSGLSPDSQSFMDANSNLDNNNNNTNLNKMDDQYVQHFFG
jgi:hypothetical protein